MKKRTCHQVTLYAIIIILIGTVAIYNFCDTKTRAQTKPMIKTRRSKHLRSKILNISCHDMKKCDALLSAKDKKFSPPNNSIYFHETSRRGNLTLRQACAVESAARTHPHRHVYVLFSSPISTYTLQKTCLAKLLAFKNVNFVRIHADEYAKGTPLESIVLHDLKKSKFPIEHIADLLRILTLYKYGGVYLDLDVIVVRPFDTLPSNWVARESNRSVSNGILAISKDELGRRFAADIISEIKETFKPDLWSHNGPLAITRVLRRMCSDNSIDNWSASSCNGMEVFGPELFYPIPLAENDTYFLPGKLKNMEGVYTHHTWNKMTSKLKIAIESPYAKLGKMYCPIIFKLYEKKYYYLL